MPMHTHMHLRTYSHARVHMRMHVSVVSNSCALTHTHACTRACALTHRQWRMHTRMRVSLCSVCTRGCMLLPLSDRLSPHRVQMAGVCCQAIAGPIPPAYGCAAPPGPPSQACRLTHTMTGGSSLWQQKAGPRLQPLDYYGVVPEGGWGWRLVSTDRRVRTPPGPAHPTGSRGLSTLGGSQFKRNRCRRFTARDLLKLPIPCRHSDDTQRALRISTSRPPARHSFIRV